MTDFETSSFHINKLVEVVSFKLPGLSMPPQTSEETPLLDHDNEQVLDFEKEDPDDPKQWPQKWKYFQVFLVSMIALVCPMASSIAAPSIDQISETFETSGTLILVSQAGFVCMLGICPLFLAPMSETFGRRPVFLVNLTVFTLLQIPTAFAPNIATFIALRTLSGIFGSVGVANGGGSVSDLFQTSERATVLGYYLLGPLLGPTLGPLLGGIVISYLSWRWLFWIQTIISASVLLACYFLLQETYKVIILEKRKSQLESQNPDVQYKVEGASSQSTAAKVATNSSRAARILVTQPVVLAMSAYQALVFASLFSLYSNFQDIWSSEPYNFTDMQVALTYLAPATGFLVAAAFIVPFIDRLYGRLAARSEDGKGVPEYRLPLANVGAVFLPLSLFWLGWTIEYGEPWPAALSATLFFGASQVSIFNTVQNYYIDSFEQYAASALAAGAFLRSMLGGLVPLFVPTMFEKLGYGWGLSVFGFISVALMPAPLIFWFYGGWLRERFKVEL